MRTKYYTKKSGELVIMSSNTYNKYHYQEEEFLKIFIHTLFRTNKIVDKLKMIIAGLIGLKPIKNQ